MGFDGKIALRDCLTEQGHLILFVVIIQRSGFVLAIVDLATEDFTLAGPTGTISAAIGEIKALTQGGIEYRFIGFDAKLVTTGLDGNGITH